MILFLLYTVGAVGCSRDFTPNARPKLTEPEITEISEDIYSSEFDRTDSATSFPTEYPSSTPSFRSTAKTDKGPSVFIENAFETKEDPSASSGEESAPTDQDESVLSEDDRKTPDPDVKWIGITVIVIILFGPPILILIAYTLRRYERVEPENGEVAGPSEPC